MELFCPQPHLFFKCINIFCPSIFFLTALFFLIFGSCSFYFINRSHMKVVHIVKCVLFLCATSMSSYDVWVSSFLGFFVACVCSPKAISSLFFFCCFNGSWRCIHFPLLITVSVVNMWPLPNVYPPCCISILNLGVHQKLRKCLLLTRSKTMPCQEIRMQTLFSTL